MSAVVGPAGCGRADLGVLYVSIGAVFQEKLNHRTMAVECGVV